MKNSQITGELSDILDLLNQASATVNQRLYGEYITKAKGLLVGLKFNLQLDSCSENETILGSDVFLEAYACDIETELDDVWKELTLRHIEQRRLKEEGEKQEARIKALENCMNVVVGKLLGMTPIGNKVFL